LLIHGVQEPNGPVPQSLLGGPLAVQLEQQNVRFRPFLVPHARRAEVKAQNRGVVNRWTTRLSCGFLPCPQAT
jgi:hypothetical protein